jgi:hypothetical protein
MNPLILALWINIAVLIPLTLSFINNSKYITDSYGLHTTSRDILLSIYLTFLFFSIYFIMTPSNSKTDTHIITLLYIQIIYKILSAITHKEYNPIIISNIVIALIFIILINF